MSSILKVDTIQDQSGNNIINENADTITIGASGDTITIPSGATLSSTDPLVFPAGTASAPAVTTTGDTNTGIFFPAADTIAFTEGGTEAMRINSSGQVGIGEVNPTAKLEVAGTGANNAGSRATYEGTIKINEAGAFTLENTGGLEFKGSTFGSGYGAKIFGADDGALLIGNRNNSATWTESMRIDSSGGLILVGSTAQKATGTTWSNPSDTRLKDNKQNYTKGLTELLQINVKTWEWNGKAGTTEGTTGIGIIADEIETILPNTIDTYKAKLNIDDTEETDVKRFDATEITWLLLNSIKEQQAIIEELKSTSTSQQTKIESLEARLTALENK